LNLCLLDFVGCCGWIPSTGGPLSGVEVACMAEERRKCDRPRNLPAMETPSDPRREGRNSSDKAKDTSAEGLCYV
jgi:hypothetical protein